MKLRANAVLSYSDESGRSTAGYRDKKWITPTVDSEHFLIANYHRIDDCRHAIRIYRF